MSGEPLDTSIGGAADRAWFAAQRARMAERSTSASTPADDVVHWVGQPGAGSTSLHGNGAASFAHTSGDEAEVTCKLCLTLLARHTPADDAGDVAEKWIAASNAARKSEHHFPADCLAEAVMTYRTLRAEADNLRAALGAARDDIRARRQEFRRLGAHEQYLAALDDAYGLVANRVPDLAADPVSLADVREGCCSAATWEEHMENHHPTDSPDGL